MSRTQSRKPKPPIWNSNNNRNNNSINKNIPALSKVNNKQTGAVSQSQTNRIRVPLSNSNNDQIAIHTQQLLQQHNNRCFVTSKPITVGRTKVPIGTAGKVVFSNGRCCCVFAVPYKGIEAAVNPILFLNFGLLSCT